jgi:hypothetical protein
MGWDSRRSYPVDVSARVTVQATVGQKARWKAAARRKGMGSAGAFLSWAADMYLALSAAHEKQALQHADECNPERSKL